MTQKQTDSSKTTITIPELISLTFGFLRVLQCNLASRPFNTEIRQYFGGKANLPDNSDADELITII